MYTNSGRVFQAFKLESKQKEMPFKTNRSNDLKVELEDSILKIESQLWNSLLGKHGVFDWEGLKFLEESFSGNPQKKHNWDFRYLIIYDHEQQPILATFMTAGLWKDDMLASLGASQKIEEERKTDPYYLTSKVLSLGSLFTEGEHLFVDYEHPGKQQALNLLVQTLEKLESTLKAKMIVLRDFQKDQEIHAYLQGQGFVRVQMPDSCSIELTKDESLETYIARLSARNRRHLRKEILETGDSLEINIIQDPTLSQLERIHELYSNVHQNNLGLNTFSFPTKLFANMWVHPNWEFITIAPKEEPNKMIGVMLCYKNIHNTYIPAFVGMDYKYLKQYHIYRQLLFQTIKRAIELKCSHISLGLTAGFEKRKLGATVEEKYSYIQTSDNYTLELIGILESN